MQECRNGPFPRGVSFWGRQRGGTAGRRQAGRLHKARGWRLHRSVKAQVGGHEKEYTNIDDGNVGVFILATQAGRVEKKVCAVLALGGYC